MNSYSQLGPDFFVEFELSDSFNRYELPVYNSTLAAEMTQNTNFQLSPGFIKSFFSDSSKESLSVKAMCYSGHQFGHFSPSLGDGRAALLAELSNKDGSCQYELHAKGVGRTPLSRGGDGLCTLRAAIKEYLFSEHMHSLRVPTTRALALASVDSFVQRNEQEKRAVFFRTAPSHIRLGSFEYFFFRNDFDNLKKLADFCINRMSINTKESVYFNLFETVAHKQIDLVVQWMSYGFIHGVMNTDNFSIFGLTLDYGPCSFVHYFKKNRVFSQIDQQGRYSYFNQINILFWNLNVWFQVMQGLFSNENRSHKDVFSDLESYFKSRFTQVMMKKFGVVDSSQEDWNLVLEFLDFIEKYRFDFTRSFRLFLSKKGGTPIEKAIFDRVKKQKSIDFSQAEALSKSVNPVLVIRNHLLDKCIKNAEEGDYGFFVKYLDYLRKPFEESNFFHDIQTYRDDLSYKTNCGT